MTYFATEEEAKKVIADILRPYFGIAQLTIAERNRINIGLREVLIVAKVKNDDEKCHAVLNKFFEAETTQSEKLILQGTKIDFLNGDEHLYILVKTVIENE